MTASEAPGARELLLLDALGNDRFRARHNLDNYAGAIFGGQALGQALAAAQRTAPDWPAHALSGYFLRAGAIGRPIDFAVERVRDGRRFAARRVVASQDGKAIFDLHCSFHAGSSPSLQHRFADAGRPPPPETLRNVQEFAADHAHRLPPGRAEMFARPFPVELRLLDSEQYFTRPGAHARDFWCRVPSATGIERAQDHQALLALLSDYWFPGIIGMPHAGHPKLRATLSLNESMWFHRAVRVDEWLLYRTETLWADEGRGLARGLIFERDGQLVASVMQEAFLPLS
ncbi:MAG: thioesterase family protein [Solimonas sp.]